MQLRRLPARRPAAGTDGRDSTDERFQPLTVVHVGAGNPQRQRQPPTVGDQMDFDDGQVTLERLLDRLTDIAPRPDRHLASLEYPRQPRCFPSLRFGSRRRSAQSRSEPAAPTEGKSVTSQPAPDLASLYPELGQASTLQIALQKAVHQAGYHLDVLPERAAGWKRSGARMDSDSRTTTAHLGIQERCFVMSFWERGVDMAAGTTTSLTEAATAVGVWQSGANLEDLRSACPFVHYGPLSEAHERGTAVENMWATYRQTAASHVDHDLIEAAYAQPQLRALYPFHSHRSLNFSRCTGFPYTHDVPVVTPTDGTYRVTWWKTRSPQGPADIGEVDNPRDAVALVIAHLPPECGPAVAGTADDLANPDSP